MIIDHIGVVVKRLQDGIDTWERMFGYRQMTDPVVNTLQNVKVVFMEKEGSLQVKLIEPAAQSSPVWAFAQRGGGLHHICFRTAEIDAGTDRLVAEGARLLVAPQPGEAFCMERIAFVYAGQGLNIELVDTQLRAALRQKSPEDIP